MSETVRLELTGRFVNDIEPDQALQNLAKALKVDLSKAQALIHSAPTIIKKQLPSHQASDYLHAFKQMGIEIIAIPLQPPQNKSLSLELEPIKQSPSVLEAKHSDQTDIVTPTPTNQNQTPSTNKVEFTGVQDHDFFTPSMFSWSLDGRLNCSRYLINVMCVLAPLTILLMISPSWLEIYLLKTLHATNKSAQLPILILFIAITWHFFRSTVLRLHDLNCPAFWAIPITLFFFCSQNICDISPQLSYSMYLLIRISGLLLLIGLIIYPGTEKDNLYGSPSEPLPLLAQVISIGVVAIILIACLYQIATSHLQYIYTKAKNNIGLSESEIQYLYNKHRPILSEKTLRLVILVEEEETGEPIQDIAAFRSKYQQDLNAMRLAQFRTLQYPLQTADIPFGQRALVSEKVLDEYVRVIGLEAGERPNREVARRELQKKYDESTRKKLGLSEASNN